MTKHRTYVVFIKQNKKGPWLYFTSHEKRTHALGTIRRLRKLGHNANMRVTLDDGRLARLHE